MLLDMTVQVAQTLGVPVALALAWRGLDILEKRGWHTTYAAAVLKAMGAGQQAAMAQGLSIFEPAGRAVAVKVGAEYLADKVGPTAAKLDIVGLDEHAARVDSQIGLLAAEAAATALVAPPVTATLANANAAMASFIKQAGVPLAVVDPAPPG